MALSTTLDGQTEKAHYDPKPSGTPSLMDSFDYVMNGKVFKIQEDAKAANKMFASSFRFVCLLCLTPCLARLSRRLVV
jgi:enhancing lycopene biosynthesis protein 2